MAPKLTGSDVMQDTDATMNGEGSNNQHARWVKEIELYEKETEQFTRRGKNILRRYKGDNDDDNPMTSYIGARYNILWSMTQTMMPALYAHNPKPNVERRNKDKDPSSRYSSMVMERCLDYFVKTESFDTAMQDSVRDRLLVGRGTVWARYVPHMRNIPPIGNAEEQEKGVELTDTVYAEDEGGEKNEAAASPEQEIYYEEVCFDWVSWDDFGYNIGRNWQEVYAVWRRVFLTREELIERFGRELGEEIPLDYTPKGLSEDKIPVYLKKACIYEIWTKNGKKALWIHRSYPDILEELDDPLELPGFFPCPKPLFATLAGDKLIPTADFIQFQDQARELDRLTSSIESITRAVKVAGVYAADEPGVTRLFSEGTETQLVPITNWQQFVTNGGLKGAFELIPMEEIVNTLTALHESRDKLLNVIYDVMGIPDIMRGISDPSETAKSQTIKSAYANTRLGAMQRQVQQQARDLVQMAGHIIAKHFTLDTIKKISGVKLMTMQEKQMFMMQQQQKMAIYQQQQMQHPVGAQSAPAPQASPPPAIPEETQELLDAPTWEEVEKLIRNEAEFGFLVDIETDSTIKMDQDDERDSRLEFLQAAGSFISEAMKIEQPILVPMMTAMLQFGVRAFPNARELESVIDTTMQKLEKQAQKTEDQPEKQDPEIMKAQASIQIEQAKQQAQLVADKQTMEMQAELDKQKMLMENELNTRKIQMESQQEAQKLTMEMQLQRDRMQMELEMKERLETQRIAIEREEIRNRPQPQSL